jgi:hypothetical protein
LKPLDSGFRRNDDLPGFKRNSKLLIHLYGDLHRHAGLKLPIAELSDPLFP